MFVQSNIADGVRQSSSEAYLRPAMKRENLHVALNCHVTKVRSVSAQPQFRIPSRKKETRNRWLQLKADKLCVAFLSTYCRTFINEKPDWKCLAYMLLKFKDEEKWENNKELNKKQPLIKWAFQLK